MKRILTTSTCFFALAIVSPGGILAQVDKIGPDEDFVIKAVTGGVAEVQASEYAEKHAYNEDVKSFAKKLAKDHTQLNKDLLEKAQGLKVGLVAGLEKERKAKYDDLIKLQGSRFDRTYIQMMIEGHVEAITVFEKESKDGSHAALKAFAGQTLPTLRQHLKEARSLLENMK